MVAVEKHIVCYAVEAWGHVRPLIHLAARFVKLRPGVIVTFLTTDGFYDRVKTELSRSFEQHEQELAERMRVISIGNTKSFVNSEEVDNNFKEVYKTLVAEGEIVCTKTAARFPSLSKPKAVVLDFFAPGPFHSVKAVSGNSVKVYGWSPGLTYAVFYLFGPESMGGKGNVRLKAEEKARLTGKSFRDAVKELVFEPVEGEIVRLPGMPPMYDHEYFPQDFPMPEELGVEVFPLVHEMMIESDGVFLFTPESYEPQAVAAVKAWYGETGRHAYATGPLLPSASQANANTKEKKLSGEANAIQAFLDETLKTSGEKSLVYISFGSIFWPVKTPEKLWAFLDVLMELNHPFILSNASPAAQIPDEIKDKVKTYGKGVLSPWTPQQLILDHPATGWFVAHGGHNGVTEAISAGVPQILWPFGGDQPLNAVHIADNLQIGYELLQVRSGHGLKQIYRTGYTPKGTIEAVKAEAREVLAKAFGEDGAKRRERLQAVRKNVTSEWEDGGASKRDVSAFLDTL
ncbi:UDP-Glycosyltransferase/glycogen phosphorylase [Daedaleopsis nitida]|nr:UDP-Glycosyltransferase/glycogen phosphorylase [Daedaleopsis nitida]